MRLRPLPVLFACRGCAAYGDCAHELAMAFDWHGLGEANWLGDPRLDEEQLAAKARSRFPVHVIDGCARRCAREWLARRGVTPQRQFILLSKRVA